MHKRRPFQLTWLLILIILLEACQARQAPLSDQLRVAVPLGRQAQALHKVALIYQQQTGTPVQVQAFETATFDYTRKIEASLFSDDGAYDLIYLPAERIMEFAAYHALAVTPPDNAPTSWHPWLSFEGQTWAYPAEIDMQLLYYRADWFNALGLAPPSTLEQWQDLLPRLTVPDDHYATALAADSQTIADATAWIFADACQTIDCWSNSPAAQSHLAIGIDHLTQILNAADWVDPRSTHMRPPAVAQALADGEIAMAVLPVSVAEPILACDNLTADVQCLSGVSPFGTAQSPGLPAHAAIIHRSVWVVPPAAPHLNSAHSFAQWLSSPAGEAAWMEAGGLPIYLSSDQTSVQPRPLPRMTDEIQKQWSPLAPQSSWGSLWQAWGEVLYQSLAQQADSQGAAVTWADRSEKIMRLNWLNEVK